jgi:hypothetical protein
MKRAFEQENQYLLTKMSTISSSRHLDVLQRLVEDLPPEEGEQLLLNLGGRLGNEEDT